VPHEFVTCIAAPLFAGLRTIPGCYTDTNATPGPAQSNHGYITPQFNINPLCPIGSFAPSLKLYTQTQ